MALGMAAAALVLPARAQLSIVWNSASGGSWTNASNWTGSVLPNGLDLAVITLPGSGPYTVTIGSSVTAAGLTLGSSNATVSLNDTILTLNPTVLGATAIGAGTLQIMNGAEVNGVGLVIPYVFANAGTITSTSTGSANYLYGSGGVTNGLAFTNAGTVTASSGTLNLGHGAGDSITNALGGTITATGPGSTITLGGGLASIINLGTLQALSGGTINLGGNLSTLQLGGTITESGTGSAINITGTLNNNAASLEAPNGGGIYTLDGGTILGGVVDNSTTPALTFASGSGSILDGASLVGNFTVPSNANITVKDGTLFQNGTTTFASSYVYLSGSAGTAVTIGNAETWTGNFSIYAQAAGMGIVNHGTLTNSGSTNYYYGAGNTGFSFTNYGAVGSLAGYQLTVGDGVNDTVLNEPGGSFVAAGANSTVIVGYSAGTVSNAGLMTATGAGSVLDLGTGATTWTNSIMGVGTGTVLAASGGTVNLGGNFTTATLNTGNYTVSGTGSTMNITGALNNAGATLEAPNGGGIFTLNGGTITGGTVDNTNAIAPALTFGTAGNTTLDGVTMEGNFTTPVSGNFWAKDGTLFTNGSTVFGNGYVYLIGPNPSTALTIDTNASWSGNVSIYAEAPGMTVVNNGSIANSASTNYFYGAGNTGFVFQNGGTVGLAAGTELIIGDGVNDTVLNEPGAIVNANGANSILVLGYNAGNVKNAGLIEATGAGSLLDLGTGTTTWANQIVGVGAGTISATGGGAVNLGGSFSTPGLTVGTYSESGVGSALNLTGALNNAGATLEHPNGGGIFTLDGGTITGGTVDNTSAITPALAFGTASGGTLNGVTMSGNFTLPSSANVYVENGTLFTGGTAAFTNNLLYLAGPNPSTALTVAAGETFTGNLSGLRAGRGHDDGEQRHDHLHGQHQLCLRGQLRRVCLRQQRYGGRHGRDRADPRGRPGGHREQFLDGQHGGERRGDIGRRL